MHLDDTILPLLEKRHYIVENSPKCATGAGLANLERTFGPDGRAGGPVSRPSRGHLELSVAESHGSRALMLEPCERDGHCVLSSPTNTPGGRTIIAGPDGDREWSVQ